MDPGSQPHQQQQYPQRPESELYSSLEVDTRAYYPQAPEVVAVDRENLPEVDHYRENLPEVAHYAGSLPSDAPEVYSGAKPAVPVKAGGGPYVGFGDQQPPLPPLPPGSPPSTMATATGTAVESVEAVPGADGPKIWGVRRKRFILLATLAAVIIVAIVVGVSVGVVTSQKSHEAEQVTDGDGDVPSTAIDGPPNDIRLDTRIASSNFTDENGNNNYLVVYQLNSGALW